MYFIWVWKLAVEWIWVVKQVCFIWVWKLTVESLCCVTTELSTFSWVRKRKATMLKMKNSISFIFRMMALFVASHYKNSPNDLQMLSDAPAHHLFCLLGPISPSSTSLPEVNKSLEFNLLSNVINQKQNK